MKHLDDKMRSYLTFLVCFFVVLTALVCTDIYKNIYYPYKRASASLLACRDCLDELYGYGAKDQSV